MAPGSATVVGIGDSVTSATVCECTGFVESYAANLPTAAGGPASGCTSTCYSPAVDAVGSDLAAVLFAATHLRGHQPTRILATDYWNVFGDGDLYAPFKGDGSLNPTTLLAADGDHPNSAGNNLISAALMAATPMGDIQHLQGTG